MLVEVINNGEALATFKKMIAAQGGNSAVVDNYKLLPQAQYKIELPAKTTGYISKMVADDIGVAAMLLGGGRQSKEDKIDYAVGLELHKKVGDSVQRGDSILTIYSNNENVDNIKDILYNSIKISDERTHLQLIHQIIK